MTTSAITPIAAPDLEVRELCVPPALVLELETPAGKGPGDISAAMGAAFGTLMRVIHTHNLVIAGAPRAIYESWNVAGSRFRVAFPIVSIPPDFDQPEAKVVTIPEQQALRFTHHGSYQTFKDTYAAISAWLHKRGGIKTDADWARYGPMWEEYVSDPTTTREQEMLTYIYLTLH
ncbi:MAG: GyrI-like domain-containing protein [bacterium]